jgi:general stress protein 26
MGSPEHKQKIWKMISEIGTGMLVTEDKGILTSRPMQLIQDDYDGTIWFYTRTDSPKVEEVKQDQNVCLSFSSPETKTYVSLTGKARLSKNKDLINKYWNPFVSAWFPEGKDSPNCALLEIKIEHGEHWDSETSKIGYLYEVAKANMTRTTPNVGENQKF